MGRNRSYIMGNSRIARSRLEGMRAEGEGILCLAENENEHTVFFPALVAQDGQHMWGRLHMEYELPEESVCSVYAFAADERHMWENAWENDMDLRRRTFAEKGILCACNCKDMLLYRLSGKYLWIEIKVIGLGGGKLHSICVEDKGDQFLDTFPEIYREQGGFFHRYLSVFSSVYQDFQKEMEGVHRWLDLDTAPKPFLYRYAQWLGLELDGEFLEEELLRRLVKNAYELNRMKGTKEAIVKLIELVSGKQAIVVERGLIRSEMTEAEKEACDRLYGESAYDITVLVDSDRAELEKSRLLFLLRQFKPVRSCLRLVFYQEYNRMDSYCYMDHNARIGRVSDAVLDKGMILDECRLG